MLIRRCNKEVFRERFDKIKAQKAKNLREADVCDQVLSFVGFGLLDDDPDCPVFYMTDKNGKEYLTAITKNQVKELCQGILSIYKDQESEEK